MICLYISDMLQHRPPCHMIKHSITRLQEARTSTMLHQKSEKLPPFSLHSHQVTKVYIRAIHWLLNIFQHFSLGSFFPVYEGHCNSVGPQMGFQCQPEVKCVNLKTRSGHIWRTVHYCPTLLKSSNNNNCLGVPGAEPDSKNRWITIQDLIFRCDSPMQMNGWHNL